MTGRAPSTLEPDDSDLGAGQGLEERTKVTKGQPQAVLLSYPLACQFPAPASLDGALLFTQGHSRDVTLAMCTWYFL